MRAINVGRTTSAAIQAQTQVARMKLLNGQLPGIIGMDGLFLVPVVVERIAAAVAQSVESVALDAVRGFAIAK